MGVLLSREADKIQNLILSKQVLNKSKTSTKTKVKVAKKVKTGKVGM